MKKRDLQNWAFGQSLESIIRSEMSTANITPDNFKKAAADLTPMQRRQLRHTIARFSKAQAQNIAQVRQGLTLSVFAGIRGFSGIFIRGAAGGISVAGIVNTIAPGLFNTLCGYLAGSANGKVALNALGKVGLVSLGAFAPPALTQYAILFIGGVSGILLYGLFVFFRWALRKLIK